MHACKHTYIPAYMHAYMPTCIHAYIHTCMHAYIHTHLPSGLPSYLPTYIPACLPTYLHTCFTCAVHTHVCAYMYCMRLCYCTRCTCIVHVHGYCSAFGWDRDGDHDRQSYPFGDSAELYGTVSSSSGFHGSFSGGAPALSIFSVPQHGGRALEILAHNYKVVSSCFFMLYKAALHN